MRAAEIHEWLGRTAGQNCSGGVTAVDLLDLPPVLNQVLRVLLAHGPMTQAQVRDALAALPDTLWLEDSDLPLALNGLVHRQWIVCEDGEPSEYEPLYSVKLRVKARINAVTRGREGLDFQP